MEARSDGDGDDGNAPAYAFESWWDEAARDSATNDWLAKSLSTRTELGMPADFMPWSKQLAELGKDLPEMTLREVDIVNVAFFKFCLNRKTFEQQLRNAGMPARRRNSTVAWWVDITQSVERAPMGALPPSVHTHSVIYSFEHNELFSGDKLGMLMGWPISVLDWTGISSGGKTNLIGEGLHTPTIALVYYSIFVSPKAPWWSSKSIPEKLGKAANPVVSKSSDAGTTWDS